MQSNGLETSGVTMPNNFVEFLKTRKEPLVPPQAPNNNEEFDRAVGAYNLRGDIRREHPDLRDTLPQYDVPEIMKWDRSSSNMSVPRQVGESLVGSAADMLKHPVATASMITALPLGFVPGIALETAGEVADEGWQDAIRLGRQILQHPSDAGHMVKGLGMSIAELPSIAKEHGKSLWNTMTKNFKGPSQPSAEDLQQTFEPMRP